MRKRVYIAYTGGTIGMKRTRDGYVPASGFLQQQMEAMPELKHPSMPRFDVHEYAPLLDSSNMTPREWVAIARDIGDHYDEYDGFVVLHGTDTMAYTTSALPFMLHGLGKPVIVTGSQIPLCEVRNDARENLITSLLIAANYDIPEVCLYFGGKLLRGCRAVKVSADGFAAFDSPNVPPLGTVGIDIEINWDLVRKPRPRQKHARRGAGLAGRQRAAALSRHLAGARAQRACVRRCRDSCSKRTASATGPITTTRSSPR